MSQKICHEVGLPTERILLGRQVAGTLPGHEEPGHEEPGHAELPAREDDAPRAPGAQDWLV